jgi:stage IV sporulation protein FB
MWRFNLFGFPVAVHWTFWLVAALLGAGFVGDSAQTKFVFLVWLGVVFVSIMVHELGHAFVMRQQGDRSVHIVLHSMGGYAQGTVWHSRREQILVSAAGPVAQMALGTLAWALLKWELVPQAFYPIVALNLLVWVSFVWALFNLLPIIPMDGGRIMESILGGKSSRLPLQISMVCAGVIALWQLSDGRLFNALIIGYMAVENYRALNGLPPVTMFGR